MTRLLFFILYLLAFVNAQDSIRVDTPIPNDVITSHRYLNITYTVLKSNTEYYPSSLSIRFAWTEKSNTANSLSFQVASNLNTNPYPGGDVERKQHWRVPNCHFFSRYSPTQYDFSMVFTPLYKQDDQQEVMTGVQQNAINVPLVIRVDNTSFPKC